ncbi:lytic murein transglycosylase [Megalodesulfovibrio gigas]|nr:lytic murein transglycosylase [Megalodesulfovibrio gigas]
MPTSFFRKLALAVLLAVLACSQVRPALAATGGGAVGMDPIWKPLIRQLVDDGFDAHEVQRMFSTPGLVYGPEFMGKKMRALYASRYSPPQPAPKAQLDPRRRKRSIYDAHIPPERLAKVRYLYWENQDVLDRVEREYGVPRQVVLAFMVIETRVGDYLGEQKAFRSLASMAATRTYGAVASHFRQFQITDPQRQWVEQRMNEKANWAYTQLKALIQYAAANRMDPVRIPGSIYGAFGLCQFIPTSALERGKDGDGDGMVNLFVPADAIMSVGHFLRVVGWKPGLSRAGKLAVIKRYNQDDAYARMVLEIAARL